MKFLARKILIWELVFRYALVMVVCALAIAIPDLGDIISLIGAMASSMLALILPPLIDQLILNNTSPKLFILKCIKNGGKSSFRHATVAHQRFSDCDFWNNGYDSWYIRFDRSVGDRSFGRWKRHMCARKFNWIAFHLVPT